MGDLAAIFHWPLGQLAAMTLPDLVHWQQIAVGCWNRMNGDGKG